MSWQEYFIRHKDGCTLNEESEKRKLTQCLIAAIERRVSHVCIRLIFQYAKLSILFAVNSEVLYGNVRCWAEVILRRGWGWISAPTTGKDCCPMSHERSVRMGCRLRGQRSGLVGKERLDRSTWLMLRARKLTRVRWSWSRRRSGDRCWRSTSHQDGAPAGYRRPAAWAEARAIAVQKITGRGSHWGDSYGRSSNGFRATSVR